MKSLSSHRINQALLFFGALLIGFYAKAQPECRFIGGIRYCNIEYWIGMSTLVGEERISSLPTGEVSIIERNHCPALYKGGTLAVSNRGRTVFLVMLHWLMAKSGGNIHLITPYQLIAR